MKTARIFLAPCAGLALAAACGGSASGPNPDADSGLNSSSSSGGSGASSGSSGGTADSGSGTAPTEGGMMAGCQCAASEVCCVTGGGGGGGGMGGRNRTFSCATSACPAGALAVVCTSAQGCGAGQQCCYLPSADVPSTTNVTACMASCPAGARQTCATDANCATGSTCEQQSGGVYGFMTCHLPPPCMGTGDCAMGQVCCSGAADGGGSNTCQSGTACSGGTTLICGATADCATGTVCCEGGGQTCQQPSACGAPGNREICNTSADCPPAFPLCRNMTCRVGLDGGAPGDGGGSTDAATGD